MAFDVTILKKQIRGIGGMLPVTLTVGSTSITAWRATIRAERKAELYGFDQEVDHSVGCIASDLPSGWEDLARVTLDGVERVILGHEYDASRTHVRLDLGSKYA